MDITAPDYLALALERAAQLLDPLPDPYWNRCDLWVLDNIDFAEGEGPTPYQLEVMRLLPEKRRIAVRGPHGLGKTTLASWIFLWYSDTRERAQVDWKVLTTASKWRQLERFLWPEIKKWARKLKRRNLRRGKELFETIMKLEFGEGFAVASDEPAAIEGAHADFLLYILDEAKAIPDDSWNAVEGAFAGGGTDTPREAFALAISTPGEPAGKFFAIHSRKPGTEDWYPIHVTLEDAIKAKRISRKWAEQRKLDWGENSSVYKIRVLGEFAGSDEDGVIPHLEWVEAANDRWLKLTDRLKTESDFSLGPLTSLGVDVARTGADRSVAAERYSRMIYQFHAWKGQDTRETSSKVGVIIANDGVAVVDVIGIGAGVVDNLREELGVQKVQAFNASERTDLVDKSGEIGFTNKRAAAWWTIRELLDPSNHYGLALPPDDTLTGDLLAPRWRMMAGGKIQIEAKDEIRKRIGRSPDYGDALAMAFFLEPTAALEEGDIIVHDDHVSISPY